MESTAKKPVGRPTRFNEQIAEKITALSKAGKTVEQIADIIGVSDRCVWMWFADKPDFFQTVKEARQFADDMVEASLFRSALGYKYSEETLAKDGTPVEIYKTAHPNATSAIFWLKNRRPKRWRDKTEIDQKTTVQGEIDCGPFKLKKPNDE